MAYRARELLGAVAALLGGDEVLDGLSSDGSDADGKGEAALPWAVGIVIWPLVVHCALQGQPLPSYLHLHTSDGNPEP